MRHSLIPAAALLAMAAVAEAQDIEAMKSRVKRLSDEVERLTLAGDSIRATLLAGEAYAVQSDVEWLEGKETAAEDEWREALKRGWGGKPPWERFPRAVRKFDPPPPQEPPPIEKVEPLPLPPPVRRRAGQAGPDLWPTIASAPYRHAHNSVWHSLFGTPPFEQAAIAPAGAWQVGFWFEYLTADFSDDGGGGTSRWNTRLHHENLEVNYSITNTILVGARISSGELYERDGDLIRVFDNFTQIVPTAERGFGADALTLRGKFATGVGFADVGVLAELKIPLSSEEDLLGAETIDLAVVGLLTKKFGKLSVHVNLGLVVPFGDPKIFVDPFDDVDSYVVFGAGVVYVVTEWASAGLQIEGNTSAFGDVAVLDERVITVSARGHFRVSDGTFVTLGVGMGLNELSGDIVASLGMEFGF